jgi:hypothetical protein
MTCGDRFRLVWDGRTPSASITLSSTPSRESPLAFQRGLREMAAQQLGTVGSGNHYVDLFEDTSDGILVDWRSLRIARVRPQDGDVGA